MSTVLTGVNGGAYLGTATCAQPGEMVTAASIQVACQAILNDAAFANADKLSKSLGGTILAPVARVGATAIEYHRTPTAIAANTVSGVISIQSDRWSSTSPTPAGNVLTLTVGETGPGNVPAGPTKIRHRVTTYGLASVTYIREDASTIITFGGGADHSDVELEWTGARWALGLYSCDGSVTVGTP